MSTDATSGSPGPTCSSCTASSTCHWARDAIDWLAGLHGHVRHVVDAGAGPGVTACAWALALPDAAVTAVDATPELLGRCMTRARRSGVADRVRVLPADLTEPAPVSLAADLVWASHVLHHLPDPVAGLRSLGSLLAEGGLLAVVEGGLPMRVLPGRHGVGPPSTMLRPAAALSDYFIETYALTPSAVNGGRDWPLLFEGAGLRHLASRSLLLDLPAPVGDDVRRVVHARWADAADLPAGRVAPDEAAGLAVLVDPDDPRGLLQRPDLFVLAASTVHVAARLAADA